MGCVSGLRRSWHRRPMPNEMCGSKTTGRVGAYPPTLSPSFDQSDANSMIEGFRKSWFWSAIRAANILLLTGRSRPSRCLPESTTQSRPSTTTPLRDRSVATGLNALSISMARAILLALGGGEVVTVLALMDQMFDRLDVCTERRPLTAIERIGLRPVVAEFRRRSPSGLVGMKLTEEPAPFSCVTLMQ